MSRLVDADVLLQKQYRIDDSATLSTRYVVNVEDIEDAPTACDILQIRAEIEQERNQQGDWSFNDGLSFALDIIDKRTKGDRE